MSVSADSQLLFGIVALRMGFVSDEELAETVTAWAADRSKPLSDVFVARGFLSPAEANQVEVAVVRYGERLHSAGASGPSSTFVTGVGELRGFDSELSGPSIAPTEDSRQTGPLPIDFASFTQVRYRVIRPHARGGLGEVFVAKDTELNREVALKEIRRENDGAAQRSRFVLEAEVTGGLEHPGIVPVYGLGHHSDGRPYYAMRFIKGDNLADAIQQFHATGDGYTSLEFRRLLQRFIDVCNAVAYAHARGVLHRDLKPGNIMLGEFGETLVVDWGLAKVVGRPDAPDVAIQPSSGSGSVETLAGSAVGTPAFMSPEQAEGRLDELGPTTDVYSLGATLYTLLTGRQPVDKGDLASMIDQVSSGVFTAPRAHNPAIPPALEAVCRKAMALKPAERYTTVRALAADIEQWLADEPVSALAEPTRVRLRRWTRKHPGAVTGLAATLVVGVLGLGLGLHFVNRERTRTELARQDEERLRIEADRQRAEATRQKEETQAVLKFVEDRVFAAARPKGQHGGLGFDVKMAEALRSALPYVAESLADQPLTEARLRQTLATSFYYLGDNATAADLYGRSRQIFESKLGPDDPDTLYAAQEYANALTELGRHSEAQALQHDILRRLKVVLGPDHPRVHSVLHNLAINYVALGRPEEALALREEALKGVKASRGPEDALTLGAMHGLANSYTSLGRHAEALALQAETLRIRMAKLGRDHPDTLMSMHTLANTYVALGRKADALAIRETTLRLRTARLGRDHPDTLASINAVSMSYEDVGRKPEALALREETVALTRVKLGVDHPDTLTAMYNLSISYSDAGRLEDALTLREEVLRLRRGRFGADHPDTLDSMHALAVGYDQAKRYKDSLALREDMVNVLKAKPERRERAASVMYDLACTNALMVEGADNPRAPADRAMNWLKQAVEHGFRNVRYLTKDTDLDALREREDFKKLVADVEAKLKTETSAEKKP